MDLTFYRDVADRLVQKIRAVLGGELTGIYLHGSMAMGCFNPDKSDIDLERVHIKLNTHISGKFCRLLR